MTRPAAAPRRNRGGFPGTARPGVSSLEVIVALGLLTAVMSTTLPLFVRHGRLLAESRQERIGIEELANLAERLAAMEPADAEAFLAAPVLSPLAAAGLPSATLAVALGEGPLGRQATLSLSWNAVGRRDQPLELTIWLAPAPAGSGRGGPRETSP
jgi:hypothetical protein